MICVRMRRNHQIDVFRAVVRSYVIDDILTIRDVPTVDHNDDLIARIAHEVAVTHDDRIAARRRILPYPNEVDFVAHVCRCGFVLSEYPCKVKPRRQPAARYRRPASPIRVCAK